jgi:hypothetical protein
VGLFLFFFVEVVPFGEGCDWDGSRDLCVTLWRFYLCIGDLLSIYLTVGYLFYCVRFILVFNMVYNESVKRDSKFTDVADIAPGNDNLRIKVRVIRMWKVPAFLNPSDYSSLEMVLVDEKVCCVGLLWVTIVWYAICVVLISYSIELCVVGW